MIKQEKIAAFRGMLREEANRVIKHHGKERSRRMPALYPPISPNKHIFLDECKEKLSEKDNLWEILSSATPQQKIVIGSVTLTWGPIP